MNAKTSNLLFGLLLAIAGGYSLSTYFKKISELSSDQGHDRSTNLPLAQNSDDSDDSAVQDPKTSTAPSRGPASIPKNDNRLVNIFERIEKSPVIEALKTKPDRYGNFRKITVVEFSQRYPRVKIEELFEEGEIVGKSYAMANQLIVQLHPGVSEETLFTSLAPVDARVVSGDPITGFYTIEFESSTIQSVESATEELRQTLDGLADFEPNYLVFRS